MNFDEYKYLFMNNEIKISCEKGWYPLIIDFLAEVDHIVRYTNLKNFKIYEIKEKHAKLCIYHTSSNNIFIDASVTVTEMRSKELCEICGKHGANMYIKKNNTCRKTLCENCSIEWGGVIY